ncbi:hypothetical protein W97_08156 [Coniosporium apollinis CBS 100218]|uniref:Pyridoxal-dependent decarboxylase n=1 Tax=Coniosporium apollinis (strain CBS 100218) TaxID=1168221 RepID=R7Z469_CONA1|nr:uncharacterized protein W97_08156 [Coniosporium apollinis CBS 100218]EON68898.1 hypothetical protein W97_08156 [Coniosporium apollinis CBS 100218]
MQRVYAAELGLDRLLELSTGADLLPSKEVLQHARSSLIPAISKEGLGLSNTVKHLKEDVVPALNLASQLPNYYGFITGGVTPVAALADNIVTAYDQNVQVHLPEETIATEVEDRALRMLCELLDFGPTEWPHKTFTTGATASNVLGLACGREFVIAEAARRTKKGPVNVGDLGLAKALRLCGLDDIRILTTVPHSSLGKAASITGIGRDSITLVGLPNAPHKFDMTKLQRILQERTSGYIVAISCAEVNTGLFATSSAAEMLELRELCDKYGAWIHVDGAFGLLVRVLEDHQYLNIRAGCDGIQFADSITGDAHKLLNVPYDCGFFLGKHRALAENVFRNSNAAYLNVGATDTSFIASPLNIGIENSRRFRALPVYASLTAYGRRGYRDMLERQVKLARGIARFILRHSEYDLLPNLEVDDERRLDSIYIIVLFRAKDDSLNKDLVKHVNATKKIYVSGTAWTGAPACRFAVSNWQVDVDRDLQLVTDVLDRVALAASHA